MSTRCPSLNDVDALRQAFVDMAGRMCTTPANLINLVDTSCGPLEIRDIWTVTADLVDGRVVPDSCQIPSEDAEYPRTELPAGHCGTTPKWWNDTTEWIEHLGLGAQDMVVMCWIDESSAYQDRPTYESDLAAYRDLVDRSGAFVVGVYVPNTSVQPVLPPNVYPPGDPPLQTVPRGSGAATLADYQELFNTLRGDIHPREIVLLVDNSGSMTTETIDPPFASFVSWLQQRWPGATIATVDYGSERWLDVITTNVAAIVGD